jgi:hypothetical protein
MFGSFQSNPPSRVLRALPPEAISLRGNAANIFNDDGNTTYEPFE